MATLSEIYGIRYDNTNLKKKVTSAVAKSAADVIAEDPGTTNHADRLVWARSTILNTPQAAEVMMWYIAQNASINASPDTATDNDILFVVNSVIDLIAG
jgi:hypothetical protein